ncbi:MAG: methyltransferase domain-containing protein [Deltaproteobacteria bacterium]|nr:methyltransferase domain-containing protein [Deltaproteobacteria bacterium]
MAELFDEWPDTYDQWFETPIGRLIKRYESELISQMLAPRSGETILDAGCGTGIFTSDIIEAGGRVFGLELSSEMLRRARVRFKANAFQPVLGNMLTLPFEDHSFQKAVSLTAMEFIEDASAAIDELFRVTQPGGVIVVATLNALSPWADLRIKEAQNGHPLFRHAIFRSPTELLNASPVKGTAKTAIHFEKGADPDTAPEIEASGQRKGLDTGAFLAVRWEKPT